MKSKKLLLLLCFPLCYSCASTVTEKKEFRNPVIPGDFADPTVIRLGETYYATGTSSEWAPHYPVFVSEDLVNWKQTAHVFEKNPEWTTGSFWAPELYYMNNKVYVYYTARNRSGVSYIGVATADKPEGPYTDHGMVVEWGSEAIDAFILEDQGTHYISWKAYGLDDRPIELIASELSADGLRMEGEPFSLMRDDERIGMEGQYWFKDGDYYYMIYSVKGCCGPRSDYQVYAARSKNLKGPYEKYEGNPILYGDGVDFTACGHGTMVTTPDGSMYYLCHAYLAGDGFYNGRQGILQEMIVDEDGWIKCTTGNVAHIAQTIPFNQTEQQAVAGFTDEFKEPERSLAWSWNFVYSDIEVKSGDGVLRLSGKPKEGNKFGTAFCVRPLKPDYVYETKVNNVNASLKGLTMYGDHKNLVALGVTGNKLMLKEVRNGKDTIISEKELPVAAPYLRIEVAKGCYCTFSYSEDGREWKEMEIAPSPKDYSYLVRWDRVARPGLIHIGSSDEPAEFTKFSLNVKQVLRF